MVALFVRAVTDDLASLVKQVQEMVIQTANKVDAEGQSIALKGYVVLISSEPESDRVKLKKWADMHGITEMPVGIFNGDEGPHNYRLKPHAEVTVMMWRKTTVISNHAFKTGTLNSTNIPAILRDAETLLK